MRRPGRLLRALGPRIVQDSLLIALCLFAPAAWGQEVLFGMNDVGQPGGPDELVRIDPATGVASRIHVFQSGLNLLESLAYDAREAVLWTTNDGVLYRVDPKTFVTTKVGDTKIRDIDGVAVQPSTGHLFGITYGGNDLVRIDKQDAGIVVLNGTLEAGSRLEDLAFDSTGRLYVLTSKAIVEVDPSTGKRISKVLLSGASSLEGLVWDRERGTFLSAADRGNFKDLVTIHRSTGVIQFVSPTLNSGFKDIEALAFVPGAPLVPVAMQAMASRRDWTGAFLSWESAENGVEFHVQRAEDERGPWEDIGTVAEPTGGRTGTWRFEYFDADAAAARLAERDLVYRVGAADGDGVWSWIQFELASHTVKRIATLYANSPNPFNPTTRFAVDLVRAAHVELVLFDAGGRRVRELGRDLGPGRHALVWDGRDDEGRAVAAGVYPYVLRAGDATRRGSAVLVK